jgi:hypothetical protein
MKDTSAICPNSARMGGSSGRIQKTPPLSIWYDTAVSRPLARSAEPCLPLLAPHQGQA